MPAIWASFARRSFTSYILIVSLLPAKESTSTEVSSTGEKSNVVSLRIRIETKLIDQLSPYHLELVNESHQHSVPANSETHWRIILVSEAFEGQGLVARHRLIYAALAEEMNDGVHALTMDLMSPNEFKATGGQLPPSPLCRGASKTS